MTMDVGFDTQAPSLPQGGGATTGLGETFTPDLSTGTGALSIALDLPNGPNNIGPHLTLRYDTAGDNGPFGMGFSIPLPRLVRSTARGFPRFDASDTLLLEGTGELVDLGGGTYRPQVDDGSWRVQAQGDGFLVTDRPGLQYTLGTTAAARLVGVTGDAIGTPLTYAWHLERINDALGNSAAFTWLRDGGQLYLSTVSYGAYQVVFHYQNRGDVRRWARVGFLISTRLRCDTIELRMPAVAQPLLRRWTLTYMQHRANGCSLLNQVTLSGFDANGGRLDAPPVRFDYADFRPSTLTRFRDPDEGVAPGPLSPVGRRVELVDWNGHGLPDLLEISAGGRARSWPNAGNCAWGRPRDVADLPLFAMPTAPAAFADMDGDGFADLIRTDLPLGRYIPRLPGTGFGPPVTWGQAPAQAPAASNTRLVDLDGDGVVDLLSSSDGWLALYYRDENRGWALPPQVMARGSAPPVDLADPHIFLADMTGDGSADLVRVDGAGVVYWPYRGLGRWDAPVAMAQPPTLPFDVHPERLILSDIDGDGCADLIYLGQGRVVYWINQVGNAFSDVKVIDYVPTGQVGEFRLVDACGSGTAGLLWSTSGPFGRGSAYYYLDFSGDQKPYLLNRIDNGIGLTTSLTYTTSAQEAARDAALGAPWLTSLPVVVPVLASFSIRDAATGRTGLTRYRYHDGRYDGILREFAGFGRVEEEQQGDATAPTLRTATWYHIGVDPTDPREPATLEERRRWRAIRGRIYRQERYGLDGSPAESLPYDRLEQRWSVMSEGTPGRTIDIPRQDGTTRTLLERAATPASVITTSNIARDAHGNVTECTQTSEIPGDPAPTRLLRTLAAFATDSAGRFLALPWRIQQFDGAGTIIADNISVYDGMPEGTVGAQGLLTERNALVLSDALVSALYATAPPDFAALGYHRRPGEQGWWSQQATYHRVDDATGLHGRVTGPRGAVTSLDFDANKTYPVSITDPTGNTLRAEYDYRVSRVTRLTNASGGTYLAAYDALAREVMTIEPGDSPALPTVSYRYAVSSTPIEVTQHQRTQSGQATTIDRRDLFDGMDTLLERRESDESGEISAISNVYNSRGLLAKSFLQHRPQQATYTVPVDALPHITFTYDALGRIVRRQNPDGGVRITAYGQLLVVEADEEDTRSGPGAPHAGTSTRKRLDAAGRIAAVEQNLAGRFLTSAYEYDLKGNLIRHVDAAGNNVRFWYDCLDRAIRVERPEQATTTVLDAAGNAVELRGQDGTTVRRDFDLSNRPVAVRFGAPAAAPAVVFTYHDAGRPTPPDAGSHTIGGRCVRIDDAGGVTTFDYDERGRVALKRSRPAGTARTDDLSFQFRADGQIDNITYPDGGSGRRVIRYEYNQRGQVLRVPSVVRNIEYDLTGRRTRVQYANLAVQTYTYDAVAHRLTAMDLTNPSGVIRSTQYATDMVGNLLHIDSPDSKLAVTFEYDDLYRLTQAQSVAGEQWTYRYDDVGNLTFKSDVGDYHYGESGAPSTCLTSAGAQSFTYSPAGEMEQTPWGQQTFDSLGRLTRIAQSDRDVTFSYDYAGRRVAEHASSVASGTSPERLTPDALYTIEGGSLVLNFYDGAGIVARASGNDVAFLHVDHLGSLVAVTDASAAVVSTLRYDPYGKVVERTGAGVAEPLGFTGGVVEQSSSLLYLQARYYQPGLGRFVSTDPIVQDVYNPITWSPYTYCADNPASYVDPTGMGLFSFLGNVVSDVVNFVGGAVKAVVSVVTDSRFWVCVAAVAALIGLAALTIVTFGAAAPLSAAAAAAIVTIAVGVLAGGVIGAITEIQRHASWEDVITGALVGAAVGGWAAYAGVVTGQAITGAMGTGFWSGVVSGMVNGAITGAGSGFTTGFAKGSSLGDVVWSMAQSAIVGLVAGALVGGIVGSATAENPIPASKTPAPPWGSLVPGGLVQAGEKVGLSQITYDSNIAALLAEKTGAKFGGDLSARVLSDAVVVIGMI